MLTQSRRAPTKRRHRHRRPPGPRPVVPFPLAADGAQEPRLPAAASPRVLPNCRLCTCPSDCPEPAQPRVGSCPDLPSACYLVREQRRDHRVGECMFHLSADSSDPELTRTSICSGRRPRAAPPEESGGGREQGRDLAARRAASAVALRSAGAGPSVGDHVDQLPQRPAQPGRRFAHQQGTLSSCGSLTPPRRRTKAVNQLLLTCNYRLSGSSARPARLLRGPRSPGLRHRDDGHVGGDLGEHLLGEVAEERSVRRAGVQLAAQHHQVRLQLAGQRHDLGGW